MEAKTTDSTDPELEMSSALSPVQVQCWSWENYYHNNFIQSSPSLAQCQGPLTSPPSNIKCWQVGCFTAVTCGDVERRDNVTCHNTLTVRERSTPEESDRDTANCSDRRQLWTNMEFTDNSLYDYYADQPLPRQVSGNRKNIKIFSLIPVFQSFESGADISLFLGVFITIVPKVKISFLK